MIDILCIVIIGIFTYLGWKKGVIRNAISLIGTCTVAILAWSLKDMLANFLIEKLPFFNYAGFFNGMSAMNILVYRIIAFIVIFVVLYCLLNIIFSLSNVVEKLAKLPLVIELPSKILGAILGLIEGIFTAFLVVFALFHISLTCSLVNNSKLGIIILERTPIIGRLAVSDTLALEEIEKIIKDDSKKSDNEDKNLRIIHTLIYYKIIDADSAQKLIDNKKIVFSYDTYFNQGEQ